MEPTGEDWRWDASLYSGSAPFYVRGRVAYPSTLVDVLVEELGLDGAGRMLDVGCGPGSLTTPMAFHFEEVVGVDPDPGMLAEAARVARCAGLHNITWVQARGEELSTDQGSFRVATLAQSFHWMDRPKVAGLLRSLLIGDGAIAFVHATTHQGVQDAPPERYPKPPRAQIEDLIRDYLGPDRRAGAGYRTGEVVTEGERGRIEAGIFTAAGFTGPLRREVPGWVVTRSTDEVVASVFSLSYAAPHLFGERVVAFEEDLRSRLTAVSPEGLFSETMREIALDFWRS